MQNLTNSRDTSFKEYRWIAEETLRSLDDTVDFFIEDIALITLPNQFVLRPNRKNGQSFRPITPICLYLSQYESIDSKADKNLEILHSKTWHDHLIDFTIAGTYVYTRALHNSDVDIDQGKNPAAVKI